MQYNFGTGLVSLVPSGSNPTPIEIGTVQDVAVDIEFATKELRGGYQFPVALARAGAKLGGKIKTGQFNGKLINQFLSGSTIGAGQTIGVADEPHPIPATPYTVTVTNVGTGITDLGVYDVTSQKPMTRVASAPTTGQYSVNLTTGVYTFAAADTTFIVWISYSYTVATGKTTAFTNQLMGSENTFAMTVFNTFGGKYSGWKFFAVVLPKLSFPFKNEDFTMPDLDFSAYADASGNVLEAYTSE